MSLKSAREEGSMAGVEARDFSAPDETRAPDKTKVDIVRMGGTSASRMSMQPGWRWSECIKPVVHTESCQVAHVGHAVSGRIKIRMNDGSETTIVPGMSYTIPPRHDAWVEGNEPFVCVEVMSAEQFAKPTG